jgi:hypothetical protein
MEGLSWVSMEVLIPRISQYVPELKDYINPRSKLEREFVREIVGRESKKF